MGICIISWLKSFPESAGPAKAIDACLRQLRIPGVKTG
jgi:hypothetical protein